MFSPPYAPPLASLSSAAPAKAHQCQPERTEARLTELDTTRAGPMAVAKHPKVKLSIALDQPTYFAGGPVTGRLELVSSTSQNLRLGEIAVELIGLEELTSYDHAASHVFLQNRILFQGGHLPPSNAVLPTAPTHGYWTARKGKTTFPYACRLTHTGPSSITLSGSAAVRYSVRASLQIWYEESHSSLVCAAEVDVAERWEDAQAPMYRQPIESVGEAKLFMGGQSGIWSEAALDRSLYFVGEQAMVRIGVRNWSKRDTSGVRLEVVRTLTFPAGGAADVQGPSISETVHTQLFQGAAFSFKAQSETVLNLPIDIPVGARTVRKTRLFGVKIEVIAALALGTFAKDLEVRLPIFVAHTEGMGSEEASPDRQSLAASDWPHQIYRSPCIRSQSVQEYRNPHIPAPVSRAVSSGAAYVHQGVPSTPCSPIIAYVNRPATSMGMHEGIQCPVFSPPFKLPQEATGPPVDIWGPDAVSYEPVHFDHLELQAPEPAPEYLRSPTSKDGTFSQPKLNHSQGSADNGADRRSCATSGVTCDARQEQHVDAKPTPVRASSVAPSRAALQDMEDPNPGLGLPIISDSPASVADSIKSAPWKSRVRTVSQREVDLFERLVNDDTVDEQAGSLAEVQSAKNSPVLKRPSPTPPSHSGGVQNTQIVPSLFSAQGQALGALETRLSLRGLASPTVRPSKACTAESTGTEAQAETKMVPKKTTVQIATGKSGTIPEAQTKIMEAPTLKHEAKQESVVNNRTPIERKERKTVMPTCRSQPLPSSNHPPRIEGLKASPSGCTASEAKSQRGGRGGRVTSVTALWSSIAEGADTAAHGPASGDAVTEKKKTEKREDGHESDGPVAELERRGVLRPSVEATPTLVPVSTVGGHGDPLHGDKLRTHLSPSSSHTRKVSSAKLVLDTPAPAPAPAAARRHTTQVRSRRPPGDERPVPLRECPTSVDGRGTTRVLGRQRMGELQALWAGAAQ